MIADDKPSLQSIFHTYLTTPETGFQEIPSTLKYSKLQFYFDKTNTPKTFAWLTEPGIFYGQVRLCLKRPYISIYLFILFFIFKFALFLFTVRPNVATKFQLTFYPK